MSLQVCRQTLCGHVRDIYCLVAEYKAKEFHYTELRLPIVRDPDPAGAGRELWIHEERSESENDEPISPAIRDARLA